MWRLEGWEDFGVGSSEATSASSTGAICFRSIAWRVCVCRAWRVRSDVVEWRWCVRRREEDVEEEKEASEEAEEESSIDLDRRFAEKKGKKK